MMKNERFLSLKQVLSDPVIFRSITKAGLSPEDEKVKKDYTENFLKICEYVAAVNKSDLPVLKKPVEHWEEYAKALVNAKTAAIRWTNGVAADLQALPGNVIAQNKSMLDLFKDALDLCDKLIEKPGRQSCIDDLKDDIEDMLRKIEKVNNLLNDVLEKLKSYSKTLPEQAKNLRSISDKALKDKKVDQDKIAELQRLIANANSEISSLSGAIAGLGIAMGAALVLSVIAVAVAGPIGALTWIFTGAAIAAAAVFIALDAEKIKKLKSEIEQNQKSMDDYTADVAALQLLSDGYKALADQSVEMQGCIKHLMEVWKALGSDLEAFRKEIVTACSLWKEKDWANVKKDFEEARKMWNKFIDQVSLLDLNETTANNCKLELGMTAAEVKAALEKGRKVNLIDYLTA